uniref:Arp2/3 complex 34 kDa subunit n=1 Tax=Nelumbo nucifera TaxID=4432 RepID=A0A822XYH8_NELNU|nr:TPA_asm: hypothetical protein HUJ06_026894 [Nelumbo nucifera]
MSLPTPPPETVFFDGLPLGAIEAVKAAFGQLVQIHDPPKDGFNLTMKFNLSKLPPEEGLTSFFSKVIMNLLYISTWDLSIIHHHLQLSSSFLLACKSFFITRISFSYLDGPISCQNFV